MSKSHRQIEADARRSPLLSSGDLVSVYVGDRGVSAVLKRRSRPVNGPLSLTFDSVNCLFAILFQFAGKRRISAGLAALSPLHTLI
jgi:hypothetical protein